VRVVVFSNLFPPLFVGGYEIGASRVVAELRRRGHDVLVLSAHEYHEQRDGAFLCRQLSREQRSSVVDVGLCVLGSLPRFCRFAPLSFFRKAWRTVRARRRYQGILRAFQPDLFLLFNPLGVMALVISDCLRLARELGVRAHLYVSDPWLAEWPRGNPLLRALVGFTRSKRWWLRVCGALATRLPGVLGWASVETPDADRTFYCSRYLRTQCGHVPGPVVPWGLPKGRVRSLNPEHFQSREPLTLLFAGQLQEHKGLTLLLRALACCRRRHRLLVIGDDQTEYATACRRLVNELGLRDRVSFFGKQTPEEMGRVLRQGQVLVVPSLWQEPFSLVVLEGMAAGLVVVASNTGGTPEAIDHGRTGFLFSPDQPGELTDLVDALERNRALCRRVGVRARQEVRRRFTIKRMVDTFLGQSGVGPGPEKRRVLPCVSS
jgi:glycosyltransferase involved in cell wall biosynthesis